MLWPYVFLIAGHSCMFGVALSALGPYLKEGVNNHGAIFDDIDMLATWKQSVATSVTLLAAMIAALSTNLFTNSLGNKRTLILNSLLWITAGGLCGVKNLYVFFVGRFILGCGVGIASTVPPVLLNEIAPASAKGLIASMHQLMITFGILVMGVTAFWMVHIEHGWWYVNCLGVAGCGVFLFFTGFTLPESPAWLLQRGQDDEALKTLWKLRKDHDYLADKPKDELGDSSAEIALLFNNNNDMGPGNNGYQSVQAVTSGLGGYDIDHLMDKGSTQQELFIQQELQEIRLSLSKGASASQMTHGEDAFGPNGDGVVDKHNQELSWGQIFTKTYRKQILLGTGCMFGSAFIGINAVTMFSTKLFGFAGLTGDQPVYGTIGLSAMGFVMSFISSILIERLGRKTLYIIGSIGSMVSLTALGLVLLCLNSYEKEQGIAAVVLLLAYLFSFNLGLGGISWCLVVELTSSKIRSKLQSLFSFQNWLGNFLVVLSTLPIVTLLGGGDSDAQQKKGVAILFLLFGAVGVLLTLFSIFALIETKGLSEHQIQLKLGNDEAQSLDIEDDDLYGNTYTRGTMM